MPRIFFMSHGSADKPVVREVAGQLGADRCWIDEGEIKPGESLFEKIDAGIADSRVFVLFWSANSAGSAWVKEELSQARLRALRDRGFRLVLVKLDATPIPDALAHRVYIDMATGLAKVVAALNETAEDLTPATVPTGSAAADDVEAFQNRETEIAKLEALALDVESAGIVIVGLAGMGKSALVRRAARRVFPHLTPIWVDLELHSTPVRLLAALARPLSLSVDVEAAAADPLAVWSDRLLSEIAEAARVFVVIDGIGSPQAARRGHTVDDLVSRIVEDLSRRPKRENPGLILISSRRPDFPPATMGRLTLVPVRGLSDQYMIRGLRMRLRQTSPDASYTQKDLEALATVLKGYPLALGLAAALVAERGLQQVVDDIQYLHKLVIGLAQELLSGISMTATEREALVLLATAARPLTDPQVRELLPESREGIDGLISKQLIDVSQQGLSLHPILRDYVTQQFAESGEIENSHTRIAALFKKYWQDAPDLSPSAAEYGSVAAYHLFATGHADASMVRASVLEEAKEAAIQLYRRRQYTTALSFLETIRKRAGGSEPSVDFYYALTLNRIGRSAEALPILKELASARPQISRYHHALGTIFRRLGDTKSAIAAFRRAVAASRQKDPVALISLAEQLDDAGDSKDALRYATRAYEINPADTIAISVLAGVLQSLGQTKDALDLIESALRRRANDGRLHAKAGVIAKQMGDLIKAKKHLLQATGDPDTAFAITALADVHIQLGEYDRAAAVLETFPAHAEFRDASYWSTKANVLRHQGLLEEGLAAIERAIEIQPKNPIHYGGLAQLHLDLASRAAQSGDSEAGALHLDQAYIAVQRGLELEPTNAALNSIARKAAALEIPRRQGPNRR